MANLTITRECRFDKEDIRKKFTTIILPGITKIHNESEKSKGLILEEAALEYLQNVLINLLEIFCSAQPHTCDDFEKFVKKFFAPPLDQYVLKSAQTNVDLLQAQQKSFKKTKSKSLYFSSDKIHSLLKEIFPYRFSQLITVQFVSMIQHITGEILFLAGAFVNFLKLNQSKVTKNSISKEDIIIAIGGDEHLSHLIKRSCNQVFLHNLQSFNDQKPSYETYDKLARDVLFKESQYLRDLKIICKVFKDPIERLCPSKYVYEIFSDIDDVLETTMTLHDNLEDAFNVEDGKPLLGNAFEEMIEGAEFEIYQRYAKDLCSPDWNLREKLDALIKNCPEIVKEFKNEKYVLDSLIYCLPNMLYEPIHHFFTYNGHLEQLIELTDDNTDKDALDQTNCVLKNIRKNIDIFIQENVDLESKSILHLHLMGNVSRQLCLQKIEEVQKNVEGIENKIDKREMEQICEQFILEGRLSKLYGKQRSNFKERYLFLFDGVLIVAKQQITSMSQQFEYRFKEKYHTRKNMDIYDVKDEGMVKNAFKLVSDEQSSIFVCQSPQEKNTWMGALIHIMARSHFDRLLENKLAEEEKYQPLPKLSPSEYKFAEPDNLKNIEYDVNANGEAECELIKGATLIKLVEKLTPPLLFNPSFIKTFLTTYRMFCQPQELLNLLIERYNIPMFCDTEVSPGAQKRFKKEFVKPIQMRTLNVFKHWVEHHWYDFDSNPELLKKLELFLTNSAEKSMNKWLISVQKVLQRKATQKELKIDYCYPTEPPPILWHITRNDNSVEYDLMTLHPVELARQITLLEFDIFKAVKSSEMVGKLWTKPDNRINSPNIVRATDFSNRFTYWLEMNILEAENLEERMYVVQRILELFLVFMQLNNFSGAIEVSAALGSSPVNRLTHTLSLDGIQNKVKYLKTLEEAREFCQDHYRKYFERLRNINPPCVPFLGPSLTHLLLTEEGNVQYLRNNKLINFSKCRKVAEITSELQQYQNQPYCLQVEPKIRYFLENLNPQGDYESIHKMEADFFEKSKIIEPRDCSRQSLMKYEKKRQYQLRSPGIKSSRLTTNKTSISSTSDPLPQTPCTPSRIVSTPVDENSDSRASSSPPDTPHSIGEERPPPIPPRRKPNIPPRLPPRSGSTHNPRNSFPSLSPPPNNSNLPNGIPILPPKTYMK